MTRGILIAGNESSLFNAVAAEALKRVEQYAAARISSQLSISASDFSGRTGGGGGEILLSWNPGSSISARTLALAAENRLGQIDDAVLVCSPPAVYRLPENLLPNEIESLVNNHIKSWFFLVRELALVFKSRKAGNLALVAPETVSPGGRENQMDLMGPSAVASFRSFTQGLLASSFEEPFSVLGFSASDSGDESGFASYIFKIIDEGNKRNIGKWHKYGKFNPFGR
jgi:hypothetical protein